jgi:phage terminase large subunit
METARATPSHLSPNPKMKSGPLVEKLINCNKKFIILQGGTASGKTVSALQYLAGIAITEGPVIITVVGQDIPNLKKGAIRDFENFVVNDAAVAPYIRSNNKSEHIWYFTNGSIIEFTSYQDEQDAKNGKRHYLFINEANGIPYAIFWQLQIRTRRKVILDYNPTAAFWVHDKLTGEDVDKEFRGRVQTYITDHRHNTFLTPEEHTNIENIGDPELWNVYARGLTGKVTGLVFGHFKRVSDPPTDFRAYYLGY